MDGSGMSRKKKQLETQITGSSGVGIGDVQFERERGFFFVLFF